MKLMGRNTSVINPALLAVMIILTKKIRWMDTSCKSFVDAYTCPVDTGRKLNVHKTFRRRPGRLMYVQFTPCLLGGEISKFKTL